MSATVHYSFAPHIAVSNVSGAPFDADMQARYRADRPDQSPPGQLWERVAELEASGMNYTERMERVKIARIAKAQGIHAEEPTRTWGFSLITGPSLVTFPNPTVSGIIHAGERIK